MESKEEDYTITNEDIKFPTFHDKSLEEYFKKSKNSKESLIQDISQIMEKFEEIINLVTDLINKNENNFRTICDSYKLNSYDFFVLFTLINKVILAIKTKVEKKNIEDFKIPSFDDFFKNIEVMDIIKDQYKVTDTNYEIIKSKIDGYINVIKTILETDHECGILFMSYVFKYLSTIILKTKNQIDLFKQIKWVTEEEDSKKYHSDMIIFFDLITIFRVLETSDILLCNSYMVDKDDLYNYEEDSEEWLQLKPIVSRIHAKNKDEIENLNIKNHKEIEKLMIFLEKAVDFDSYLITNAFKALGLYLKFKLNFDENLMEFESKQNSLLNPDKKFFIDLAKIGNYPLIKTIRMSGYPKIAVREKIYMKRKYPEISLELIKNLLCKIYDKEIIEKNFENVKQNDREELDENLLKNFPNWAKEVPKVYKPYFISTRLLNSFEFKNFGLQDYKTSFFGLFKSKVEDKDPEEVKGLMIFIHGGGFLKTKSYFHETYLREICNNTKIPILCINYTGAPEHPYPEGLNDCYQVYMWIVEHCEQELGFIPEKIILSGDSSGGNLALALTFLLISLYLYEGKNIKLPDLLLPLYPACHTGVKNMSLSLASSFEDFLLGIKSLLFINKVYRGYYPNDLDPFLNPSEVTEDILKLLPKTIFLNATNDPLRDDSIRLIRKIAKIPGLDVKDYELQNYQHGFMGAEDANISGLPRRLVSKFINDFLNDN